MTLISFYIYISIIYNSTILQCNIQVHLRQPGDTEQSLARTPDVMKQLVDAASVPVLCNGDMYTLQVRLSLSLKSMI